MTSALENYINRILWRPPPARAGAVLPGTVAVITSDGRMIVGTLKGFDQTINLILDESHERVFSSSQGVEQVVLGLYIVRGDNVAVIGEIDEETDSALDLGNIRAEPLNSVAH
ncbi:LSM8 homolog, U6 small nuclear RNA associated isoform X1 [Eptesicus fuscus]|uniref:LSM8 homolog, U6 small nuclear RNA associated isoform X1 n=1 Tax=Eptesicus fuscus TaxID=29078 RepID=UPI002403F135|nr:LSM8 homolog, U6 small nuclear RNA associated isoform X1 [Eptesicus fuscus]